MKPTIKLRLAKHDKQSATKAPEAPKQRTGELRSSPEESESDDSYSIHNYPDLPAIIVREFSKVTTADKPDSK